MLVWLVATQARAELTLKIVDNVTGDGVRVIDRSGTFDKKFFGNSANVTITSITGTASSFHFIGTIDGYKFDVTTSTTLPGNHPVNKVSANYTVTATSSATKTSFNTTVSDGPFPVVSGLKLSVTASSGSSFPVGTSLLDKGAYNAYTNKFVETGTGDTSVISLTGPNQSKTSTSVPLVPNGGTKYALKELGGALKLTGTGTVKFFSQATTVPEATGWVAALLALSCAAMVVVRGKRRKTAGLHPVV
jgi:hypothetical protein